MCGNTLNKFIGGKANSIPMLSRTQTASGEHLKLRREQCKSPSTPRPLLIFTEIRGISEHLSDGMAVVIRGDVWTIGALRNREEI